MNRRFEIALCSAAIGLAVAVGSPESLALPKEGALAPNARLENADGGAREIKGWKGKPILIVYEDKDSATQNKTLKDELAKLAKGDRYKATVALAAVADVSSYDFWPVKGFVKDAIRDESKKAGTTIYCDWTGAFREAYQIKRGSSSVILVGKEGRVLFAAQGPVSSADRTRLLGLLRAQLGV
jgi:hypothetical protein